MGTATRARFSITCQCSGMRRLPLLHAVLVPMLFLMLPVAVCFSMDRVNPKRECSHCHRLSMSEATRLLAPLNVKVTSVQHSPLKGLFEVSAERDGKTGLIFVDYAKSYVMQGVMVRADDLAKGNSFKNSADDPASRDRVSRLLRANSILLGNAAARTQIVVFSDPDCPFCRRLHAELLKLAGEMDVAVYVKLFPAPAHSEAYGKSRVLLGKNSLDLLNRAFAGEKIPEPTDADGREPVEETIALANSLGIKGTPAMLFPNGKVEVGYRDVAALKKLIEQNR